VATGLEHEFDLWARDLGLNTSNDGWTIKFTISTVPIENWFYSRNKLNPEDLKLELIVPQWGLWNAQFDRHDGLFQVQWRPSNAMYVESQQLKYRKIMQWPQLESLNEFPALVEKIESLLEVEFIRHVDVGARYIDLSQSLEKESKLHKWLSPCADTVGRLMRSA
jgi:hypothetical protein